MAAVDTNVVVRFLAADEPVQAAQAADRIARGAWVSHGVLIETEWVLRSSYRWDRQRTNNALRQFLAIRQVETEHGEALIWALDQHRRGADWADMLHLIAARLQTSFITFDLSLAADAGDHAPTQVEVLQ